jgi:hypothetical protein
MDDAKDDAKARVERMRQQVRAQVLARLAWPWRFERYELADLAEPQSDRRELEHFLWELDLRYRQTILREDEL